MFSWIKRLFGAQTPVSSPSSPEDEARSRAFDEARQSALDDALGQMHEFVIHATIPFFVGGALDLYLFRRHIPGTLYVTQELFTWDKESRPKPSRQGYFELAAAFRPEEDPMPQAIPKSAGKAGNILNPVSRFASMAVLNPGETAEIPSGDGEPNTCIVFDRLDLHGKSLAVLGEPFFILLVIHIHPSELAFARQESSAKLFERLKARGYYPYSDLDRDPVA